MNVKITVIYDNTVIVDNILFEDVRLLQTGFSSLDYVVGTFRLPNYDQEEPVLNTRLSSINILEYGGTYGTADNQIDAGLRRVYNQSRYFAHNGDSMKTTQWKVRNTTNK
jgi:hypothetical protein